MHVLVTGGTGTLGRHVVERLLGAGHDVRVLSRRSLPKLPLGAEPAHGDVLDPPSLTQAMAGIEVVVHSATGRRRIHDTEVYGTRNVMQAAEAALVDHVVYTSIVGCDRNPFFYYKAKVAAEAAVEESPVRSTIVRITQFHDLIDGFLTAVSRVPAVLPLPRGIRLQPIEPADAAVHVARTAVGKPVGRAADVGGPEVRALEDLARTWMQATGKRRRIVQAPLPGGTVKAYRAGSAIAPERAVGTTTWEDWLTARSTP